MLNRAGIACGYSIFPVEDALSIRETSREENSTRIRDLLGTPEGRRCCPYVFNGFHETDLIVLASTRAAAGQGNARR